MPLKRSGWVIAALAVFVGGSCQRSMDTEKVFVFGAASLGEALTEVAVSFEEETGIEVALNLAGSNALAQQIRFSNRADVFISADESWMDFLETNDRLLVGARRVLLTNSLVAVAAKESKWAIESPAELCASDFRYLCIGDPDSVPVGRYAKRWLESIQWADGTAWDLVRERVSPAPDAPAVLGQVSSRRDAVGIVYRTDYLRSLESVRLLFRISEERARYPISLIRESPNPEGGAAFLKFAMSDSVSEIWERYGFGLAED